MRPSRQRYGLPAVFRLPLHGHAGAQGQASSHAGPLHTGFRQHISPAGYDHHLRLNQPFFRLGASQQSILCYPAGIAVKGAYRYHVLFGFTGNFHRHAQQKLIHQTGLLRVLRPEGRVCGKRRYGHVDYCLHCYFLTVLSQSQFSPARWQATIRPSHSRSSGTSVRQRSVA